MAKVKDQIRDNSEVSYIDAAGRVCYTHELFGHIMPDAYPLPSLNPTGVARKSNKGNKPSTQGEGSPAQLPWRMCFQACADKWRALPDVCPDPTPCHMKSSKEKVWDAKNEQGVMCSYYDLFMSCCMKFCARISVTGPDGTTFGGGFIPEDIDCFPCDMPCNNSSLEISYTTLAMSVNQSQELSATDSDGGSSMSCFQPEDLVWEIMSGGGYLNPSVGFTVGYHAPASNPDCVMNPTIKLTDSCQRTAELTLAVNSAPSNFVAYELKAAGDTGPCCAYIPHSCGPECIEIYCGKQTFFDCIQYYCSGEEIGRCTNPFVCAYSSPPGVWEDHGYCSPVGGIGFCGQSTPLGITDRRTDAQKAAGCCPPELI